MKIIACCKAIPDEQDIVVLSNQELSFEKATWKIGQYDLNAIEAGKQLAAETGGTMTALSVGDAVLKNTKLRKDILSRGANDLALVIDETKELSDSLETAKVLAAGVTEIGEFDLVICGTGSSDLYNQQVGNQLGTLLDIAVVNGVSKITPGEGKIVVERVLENEVEVLELTLPAVVSVNSDMNIPSIPGMKDILRAGKKPVKELEVDLSGNMKSTEKVSELAPLQKERKQEVVEGDSEEAVDALVQFLKREVL